jgi:hypothetical protein
MCIILCRCEHRPVLFKYFNAHLLKKREDRRARALEIEYQEVDNGVGRHHSVGAIVHLADRPPFFKSIAKLVEANVDLGVRTD